MKSASKFKKIRMFFAIFTLLVATVLAGAPATIADTGGGDPPIQNPEPITTSLDSLLLIAQLTIPIL